VGNLKNGRDRKREKKMPVGLKFIRGIRKKKGRQRVGQDGVRLRENNPLSSEQNSRRLRCKRRSGGETFWRFVIKPVGQKRRARVERCETCSRGRRYVKKCQIVQENRKESPGLEKKIETIPNIVRENVKIGDALLKRRLPRGGANVRQVGEGKGRRNWNVERDKGRKQWRKVELRSVVYQGSILGKTQGPGKNKVHRWRA